MPSQDASALIASITVDDIDFDAGTITFTAIPDSIENDLTAVVITDITIDDTTGNGAVALTGVSSVDFAGISLTVVITLGELDRFTILDTLTETEDLILDIASISDDVDATTALTTTNAPPVAVDTLDTTASTFTADHTVAGTIVLTFTEFLDTDAVTDGTGFSLAVGNVTGNTDPAGISNVVTLTVNAEGTGVLNVTYDNSTGPVVDGAAIQAAFATNLANDNVETTITATTLTATTTRVDFSESVAGTFTNGNWVVQAAGNDVLSVQGAQTGITTMVITHNAIGTNATPTVTFTTGEVITDEGANNVVFTTVASAAATDSSPPVVVTTEQTSLTNIDVTFDEDIDTVALTTTNGWSLTNAPGATVDAITDVSGGDAVVIQLTVDGLTGGSMPTVNYVGPTATTPILDNAGSNAAVAAFDEAAADLTGPAISTVSYDATTGILTMVWNETVDVVTFKAAIDNGDFNLEDNDVGHLTIAGTAVNTTTNGLTMTITLNPADQATVNAFPVPPLNLDHAGGVVADDDGNLSAAQANVAVTLGTDTAAPIMTGATTATTTTISVQFNELLDQGTVDDADFAVAGNTIGGTAAGATNDIVVITLDNAIETDEVPSVSLTNGAAGIDDLSGNINTSTTSVVPTDGIKPTVVSISTLTKNSFRAIFSEPVTSTSIDWSGLDFVTAGTRNVTTLSGSGTENIDVTFDGDPLVNTADVQNADGTGLARAAIDDLSGNAIAQDLNHAIADGLVPEIISATIDGGNSILLVYSEIDVTHVQADYTNLTVLASAPNIVGHGTANAGTTTEAALTFDGDAVGINATGTLTVSFAGNVVDASGNLLDVQNIALTDAQVPSVVTAVITSPTQVTITFNEEVLSTLADYVDLNLTLASLVTITDVDLSANPVVVLTHNESAAGDETGTVNILATLTDVATNPIAPVIPQAITDGQKPVVTSATITDAGTIVVVYSESITSTFNDYTNLILTPGGIHTVTNASVDVDTVTLTISPADAALTATGTMVISANNLVADNAAAPNLLDTDTVNVTAGQEPSFTATTETTTTTRVTFSETVDGDIILNDWTIAGAAPTVSDPTVGANPFSGTTVLFTHTDTEDTAATPAVVYVPGDLQDQAGTLNVLAGATVTAADGVVPIFTVQTVDLNTLRVTFSENVNSATDLATAWTVANAHVVVGVSTLDGTGNTLDIDITGTPLADGAETPAVTYTVGDVEDAAENALVTATPATTDGIVPTILTSVITAGNEIVVTFSEINMTVLLSDFTLLVLNGNDGRNVGMGVLSVNNSVITLAFDGTAASADSVATMTASFADNIEDGAAIPNKLGSTPLNVTAGQQPFIDTVETGPAANQITITYSEVIDSPTNADQAAAFTVTGGLTVTGAPDPASTNTVTLTLSGNLGTSDTPTVNYDATVGNLEDLANIDVLTSSDVATDGILPTFAVSTQDLNTLRVTFSENVNSATDLATAWTVANAHVVVGVSTLDGTGNTLDIDITGTPLADGAETPAVTYTVGDVEDAAENALATATPATTDGIVPVLLWAEISDTAQEIVMVFNEEVVSDGGDYTGFALNVNDFRNIANAVVTTTNIETLTFDNAAQAADDVGTINVGASGDIVDTGTNKFVARTGVTVNADAKPSLLTAQFTGGNEITLTFDEPVIATTASFTTLTLSTGATPAISAVTGINTTTLVLTFYLDPVVGTVTGTMNVSDAGSPVTDLTTIAAKDVDLIPDQVIAAGGAISAPVITSPTDGDSFADAAVTVDGTYGAGTATINIVDTDGTTVLGTMDADGSGTFSIDTTLTEGAHTLTAQAVDGFGTTNSVAVNVTVDLTAPDAPVITSPTDGDSFADAAVTVDGTYGAGTATINIVDTDGTTVLGTMDADGSGTFSIDTTLTEGAHTLTAQAVDGFGTTNSVAVNVTVDLTAPDAPVITSPIDAAVLSTTTFDVVGTAEADSIIDVLVDGTSSAPGTTDGNGDFTVEITITGTTAAITATATDAVGNTSDASTAVNVTTGVSSELPLHVTDLLSVYDARPDLQDAFPNVDSSTGTDMNALLRWAGVFGVSEDSTLAAHDAVYDTMWVFFFRSDISTAFPEANNGADVTRLLSWASTDGVAEEPAILGPHQEVYDLMRVYNERSDVAGAFPEALDAQNMDNLFTWAANHGVTENSNILAQHDALYTIMDLYNIRTDVASEFPEAQNAGDIVRLYSWAVNFGFTENPELLGTNTGQYNDPTLHIVP